MRRFPLPYATWLTGFLIACLASAAAVAQPLTAENTSRYLGNGRWNWTIYLAGPDSLIDRVSCVQYTLHPTFPNPVREICALGNRQQAFALSATGWGTFNVPVRITFKDGTTQNLAHTLVFETRETSSSSPLHVRNTVRTVQAGLYEWVIFVEGSGDVLEKVQCVQYTLDPTFPDPVREVCDRGVGPHAFALTIKGWGAFGGFTVHVRVRFKDGSVHSMTYELRV
jgi:transcription initiation factor IIF auxiliary subunit